MVTNFFIISFKKNLIQVKCLNPNCGFESRTFDFFLDLAVNIPEPHKEKETYIAKPSTSSKKRNNKRTHKKIKQKKIKITDEEEEIKEEEDENEGKEDENEGKEEKIEGKEEKIEGKEEKIEGKEEKIKEKEEKEKQAEPEEKNENLPEKELPFRPIDNSKLESVPYLDKDLYLLYEPNYKSHNINYQVF